MPPLCFQPGLCLAQTRFCVAQRAVCMHNSRLAAPCLAVHATAATPPPPPPDAAASTVVATPPSSAEAASLGPALLCPACSAPLPPAAPPLSRTLVAACPACSARLPRRDGYVDLTPPPPTRTAAAAAAASLLPPWLRPQPSQQVLFQLPQVAYAYERGWRAGFARAGFPGPSVEAALALDFLLPAPIVLDLSCGSGVLTRALAAAAGSDTRLVATDISAAMLRDAVRRAKADVALPELDFVRADVLALPIADASVAAVHAGAALHCWPRLQDALAEVHRVLSPGGRFFATTFRKQAYLRERVPLVADFVSRGEASSFGLQPTPLYRFFEVAELKYLLRAAGFVDVDVQCEKSFITVRCAKER